MKNKQDFQLCIFSSCNQSEDWIIKWQEHAEDFCLWIFRSSLFVRPAPTWSRTKRPWTSHDVDERWMKGSNVWSCANSSWMIKAVNTAGAAIWLRDLSSRCCLTDMSYTHDLSLKNLESSDGKPLMALRDNRKQSDVEKWTFSILFILVLRKIKIYINVK